MTAIFRVLGSIFEKIKFRTKKTMPTITTDVGISENDALRLGGIKITVSSNTIFPWGDIGCCYYNAFSLVLRGHAESYCLGFAAGGNAAYAPHAWVKNNGHYIDNTPQSTDRSATHRLYKYILLYELNGNQLHHEYMTFNIDTDKDSGILPIEMDFNGNMIMAIIKNGKPERLGIVANAITYMSSRQQTATEAGDPT